MVAIKEGVIDRLFISYCSSINNLKKSPSTYPKILMSRKIFFDVM